MNAKVHDWLADQIEAARPGKATAQAVPQLVEAAASLLPTPTASGQAFGLVVSGPLDGGPALAQRCLSLVGEWLPLLQPAERDEVGLMLNRLQLPALVPTPSMPNVIARLEVFVGAGVTNFETGDDVHDRALLAKLDGVREVTGISLVELPCIDDVVGRRTGELLPTTERWRRAWAIDGSATLAFDRAAQQLRCRLDFELTQSPEREEVERLLEVIGKELFFSGWGTNLDWDTGEIDGFDDLRVFVESKVLEHRIVPVAGSNHRRA